MPKMLFQKECPLFSLAIFVCALLFVESCKSKASSTPDNYQFNKPEKTELGKVLNEISGICFDPSDSNLLAISDSKERVYQLDLKRTKLHDYTSKVVPPNSDLEDI